MKAVCAVLTTVLFACGSTSGTSSGPPPEAPTAEVSPTVAVTAEPQVTAARPQLAKVSVVMASATLADDCVGEVMAPPPPTPADPPATPKPTAPVWSNKGASAMDDSAAPRKAKSRRRERVCEQTSMQLSISATPGEAVKFAVKKVEIFDEAGRSLGELTPREPSIWSETGSYGPWDERITASGQYSVSYALSQPGWGGEDRRNKTYVVRALVSVGGDEQSVTREVAIQREVIIEAPTNLPAMVKT